MNSSEMISYVKNKFNFDQTTAILVVLNLLDCDSNSVEANDESFDVMFDFYCDNGEMPYGTAKAKDGDPCVWIYETLCAEVGIQ